MVILTWPASVEILNTEPRNAQPPTEITMPSSQLRGLSPPGHAGFRRNLCTSVYGQSRGIQFKQTTSNSRVCKDTAGILHEGEGTLYYPPGQGYQ